ncbi:MAG: prepilin peptidase [Verrucomicrobiae bacterium]|nr:prepilin peptidase [Verrucomicrobiae bacterium]
MTDRYLGLPLDFWQPEFLGIPHPIWTLAFTAVGLIVGSFLNVVIHRLPLGESVITPPSRCPQCRTRIPLRYNLPVLSWFLLRGRSACCGLPISWRYPAIEALTGGLFLATWLVFGYTDPWVAVGLCVLFSGFIAATFIDLDHLIIPDEITLGGVAAGFLLSAVIPGLQQADSPMEAMKRSGVGILVGASLVYTVLRLGKLVFGRQRIQLPEGSRVRFLETGLHLPSGEVAYGELFYRRSDAVRLRARRLELADRCYRDCRVEVLLAATPPVVRVAGEEFNAEDEPYLEAEADRIELPREAMGLGDVKFMAAIGAFLGWPCTVFSLFFSAVIGSVVAGVLIAAGRQTLSGRLGYGPYIALAAMTWVFGGRDLVARWLGL